MRVHDKEVRATLRQAHIPLSKTADANAFLADRAPRVELRCILSDAGPSLVVDVELLAWRDKSGDVWQNMGTQLIEQGLAEPVNSSKK